MMRYWIEMQESQFVELQKIGSELEILKNILQYKKSK